MKNDFPWNCDVKQIMGRKRKQEPTTLLFLLQSLIDAEIIVELRNETQIVGTLDHVDNAMKYTFLRS